MLVEIVYLDPKKPIGTKLAEIYAQFETDFTLSLLNGNIHAKADPLQYLDICLLWYRQGEPLNMYCEPFGEPERILECLRNIEREPAWRDRTQTLTTAILQAEGTCPAGEIPYLLGAVGNIRSTSEFPIVVCFQRRILPRGLVAAVCSYHPRQSS